MDRIHELEELMLNIRDGNAAVRVIGFAGLHQQVDEQEMGQALVFVAGCLDDILDRSNEIIDEVIAELHPDQTKCR